MPPKRKPEPAISRVCRLVTCRTPFETRRVAQVFCSRSCCQKGAAEAWRSLNPPAKIPTATTGTIAELVVAIDLLEKGYSVFRAMSPSCECDLAVLLNGALCRVEVKTGYMSVKGSVTFPKCDAEKYDVLAIVRRGQILEYRPSFETWFRERNNNVG